MKYKIGQRIKVIEDEKAKEPTPSIGKIGTITKISENPEDEYPYTITIKNTIKDKIRERLINLNEKEIKPITENNMLLKIKESLK